MFALLALRALRLFVFFACVVLLRCLRNFFAQELALCLALRALRWVETGLNPLPLYSLTGQNMASTIVT